MTSPITAEEEIARIIDPHAFENRVDIPMPSSRDIAAWQAAAKSKARDILARVGLLPTNPVTPDIKIGDMITLRGEVVLIHNRDGDEAVFISFKWCGVGHWSYVPRAAILAINDAPIDALTRLSPEPK